MGLFFFISVLITSFFAMRFLSAVEDAVKQCDDSDDPENKP